MSSNRGDEKEGNEEKKEIEQDEAPYIFEEYRDKIYYTDFFKRVKGIKRTVPLEDSPLKTKTKAQRDYEIEFDKNGYSYKDENIRNKKHLDYNSLLIVSQFIPDKSNLINLQMTSKRAIGVMSVLTNQFNTYDVGPYNNLDSHTIYTELENAPRDFMKDYSHILHGTATSYNDYLNVEITTFHKVKDGNNDDVDLREKVVVAPEKRLYNYKLVGCTKEIPFELMQLLMTYLNTIPRKAFYNIYKISSSARRTKRIDSVRKKYPRPCVFPP